MKPDGKGGRATVDAIVEWNCGRDPALVREKYDRMRGDLFAFFRGTNHLFATDWADLGPAEPGPEIWVCGDLHLKNFGCFRSDEGATVFDINDFDEAVVAPCSVDLVRCATGIILAGEIWGHSPLRVMRMVLAYLDGYRAAIIAMARTEGDADLPRTATHAAILALKAATRGPIAELIDVSDAKKQLDLLDRLTRLDHDGERTLKRAGRFFDPPPADKETLIRAIEDYGRARGEPDTFQVVDFAGRVAGIGSLGVRRYAALVAGDGQATGHRLFDIKEASPPAFRVFAAPAGLLDGGSIDQARRIVAAQRLLQAQPTAGLDVLDVAGVGYCLRELIPEENRARLDQFQEDAGKLRRGLDHAGWITAHAHLRGAQVDAEDRTARLLAWAAGPALDAVLAAAVRFADRNRAHYKTFRKAKLDPTD